jgi:hypothetical protein
MSLDHTDEITYEPRLLFTEPWDPIVVRRGDALGLLALTNVFAETVAPGLSKSATDNGSQSWRGVLCDRRGTGHPLPASYLPRASDEIKLQR